MRIRVHPHLSDLAGTGLVLIGFLLVAMAVSAAPILVRSLSGRTVAPAVHQPVVSPLPGRPMSLS